MKSKRIIAIVLSCVILLGLMPIGAFAAPLTADKMPPRVTQTILKKTQTEYFAMDKVLFSGDWGPVFGEDTATAAAVTTAGINGTDVIAAKFSQGGRRFFMGAYDFTLFTEIIMEVKSNSTLQIRFEKEYQMDKTRSFTKTVSIPSTNGQWKTVKILREDFYGDTAGQMSNAEVDGLKHNFDEKRPVNEKYNPAIVMSMGGTDVLMTNFTVNWFVKETNLSVTERKTQNFTTGGVDCWGQWGTARRNGEVWKAPVISKSGGSEDGTASALYVGCVANRIDTAEPNSYAGAQITAGNEMVKFSPSNPWNAIRVKYASNVGMNIGMGLQYEADPPEGVAGKPTSGEGSLPATASQQACPDIQVAADRVWKTIDIPASKFYGETNPNPARNWIFEFNKVFDPNKTNYKGEKGAFYPQNLFRFGGLNKLDKATNEDNPKIGTMIESIEMVWYDAVPEFESIEMTNNGFVTEGLEDGTTDIDFVLKNDSQKEAKGALVVAAIYDTLTNCVIAVNVKSIDVSAASKTPKQRLSVEMPGEIFVDEQHLFKLMLFKDSTSFEQITLPLQMNLFNILPYPVQ